VLVVPPHKKQFIIDECLYIEIATDILEFVAKETEEMEARKILLEFMGKVWGEGNTVLHLASFLGISGLVKRLLELGANMNKRNQRSYKAVDCADDDITRNLFLDSYSAQGMCCFLELEPFG
jgi:hypothetical protein